MAFIDIFANVVFAPFVILKHTRATPPQIYNEKINDLLSTFKGATCADEHKTNVSIWLWTKRTKDSPLPLNQSSVIWARTCQLNLMSVICIPVCSVPVMTWKRITQARPTCLTSSTFGFVQIGWIYIVDSRVQYCTSFSERTSLIQSLNHGFDSTIFKVFCTWDLTGQRFGRGWTTYCSRHAKALCRMHCHELAGAAHLSFLLDYVKLALDFLHVCVIEFVFTTACIILPVVTQSQRLQPPGDWH